MLSWITSLYFVQLWALIIAIAPTSYVFFAWLMAVIMGDDLPAPKTLKKALLEGIFVVIVGSPLTTLWIYATLHGYIGNLYYDIGEHGWSYFLLSGLWYVFILDTIVYFSHRMYHSVPFLYKYHSLHHEYVPAITFSAASLDAVEYMISGINPIFMPVLLIRPLHIAWIPIIMTFTIVWGTYIHSTKSHSFGAIMSDNRDHQVHHSRRKVNYGTYFRFWDKVCGTYGTSSPIS